MTVKQRLVEFISYKGISIRSFCKMIGVSSSYVTSMRSSIQPQKLDVIAREFPDLNLGWLITGEGSMLRADNPMLPAIDQAKLVQMASDVYKDKLIDMFKRGEIYSAEVVKEKDAIIKRCYDELSSLKNEIENLKEIIKKYEVHSDK